MTDPVETIRVAHGEAGVRLDKWFKTHFPDITHGYLQKRLPVPIINPGPLSYKIAEAALAFELAASAKAKFGGDTIGDFTAAHAAYLARIDWRRS